MATPRQELQELEELEALEARAAKPVAATVGSTTAPAERVAEPLSVGERVRRGVAASGIKLGLAVGDIAQASPIPAFVRKGGELFGKDLSFMPSDEMRKAVLAESAADVAEGGGVSKAGEIGADIATLAIPGARAYSGAANLAKAVPLLKTFPRVAAALTSGAAVGGAVTPGELTTAEGLQERGEGALYGAAGGLAGEAGGRVLKRTLAGLVTPSKQATELMAQGITPTVGQGGTGVSGAVARGLENLVAGVPGAGTIVKAGQERALGELRTTLAKDILGEGPDFARVAAAEPRAAIKDIGQTLGKRYDEALAAMEPIAVTPELRSVVSTTAKQLPQDVRAEYDSLAKTYLRGKGELDPAKLKEFRSQLGELASDLGRSERTMDKRAGKTIGALRDKLSDLMSPAVREVDESWSKFLRLRDAASRAGQEEGVTAKALQDAVRKAGGKKAFAEGEALLQDVTEPAQILKQTGKGGVLPTALAAGAGFLNTPATIAAMVASALGSTKAGAKLAFGETAPQKAMAEALRRYGAPAGAAATQPDEEYQ